MNRRKVIAYLQKNKSSFEQKFGIKRIGVFGSFARNENQDTSDLDIVVELVKPDMFSLIGIKQTIEKDLGVKVDIVRMRKTMNPNLKRRIEEDVRYV